MGIVSFSSLRGVFFALMGFALWVVADSCMKLAGEADLPAYEVVGFLGFFAAVTTAAIHAPQGKMKDLWPKSPGIQVVRGLLAFGTVMANAFALKCLPLTIFYVVVFLSPMMIAVLAAVLLREQLSFAKIAAIAVGFVGVVIAIDPSNSVGSGNWIGYVATISAAFFYSVCTILTRIKTQSETAHSIVFFTGFVEAVLGFGTMLWHAVPISTYVFMILAVMGVMNSLGNVCNCIALRTMPAASVEHFHYSQIVFGAAVGYVLWNEVPTQHMVIGAIVIILCGLYVAASMHKAEKLAIATDG